MIVNVSSVHEVIPWPEFSHYCASKGATKLFGQTIARELAPDGIRVVQVAPGAILTPINQDLIDHPGKRRDIEEESPWGRMGSPKKSPVRFAVCGRKDEARAVFERLLGFAGPLGLFAEEIDAQSGDQLGNYPQAFTHIGLISAAFDLEGKGAGSARRAARANTRPPLTQSSNTPEGK